MGKSSKSLSEQASKYFFGRAAALVIHFIVPMVLVRIFVKSDFGLFAQILLIYEFLFRVFRFGLVQSVYYFLPLQSQNKAYYITNTIVFLAIGGILNIVFLTLFKTDIASLLNADEIAPLLPLCGLHILFRLVSSPFEPTLIVESNAKTASLVVFGSQVVRGFFIIILVLIYKSVFSAVIGLVCYSFLRLLFYVIYVQRNIGLKFDSHSIKHFKEQIKYAAPLGFSGIISNIYKRIDKFILSMLFTPELFAIYRIGNFKIPFVQILFKSVSEVAMPTVVKLLKDKKVDQFLELWKKLLIRFSYIGIGMFFFFQVIAYDIVTLMFTEDYASSVPVFRIFLSLTLGAMLQYGIILRSIGHTKAIFNSNLMAFIVSVPVAFVLIKEFGAIGAAAAALLGYFLNISAQMVYSVKGLQRKFTDIFPVLTMVKFTLVGLFLFALLYTTQDFIHYKILRIIYSGVIYLVAYTVLCWKTGTFNIFEEKLLINLMRKLQLLKT